MISPQSIGSRAASRRSEFASPSAGKRLSQTDAGFPGEQHHLAFASLRLRPAPEQQFEFFLATNKFGQSTRVQGLEAALSAARA